MFLEAALGWTDLKPWILNQFDCLDKFMLGEFQIHPLLIHVDAMKIMILLKSNSLIQTQPARIDKLTWTYTKSPTYMHTSMSRILKGPTYLLGQGTFLT